MGITNLQDAKRRKTALTMYHCYTMNKVKKQRKKCTSARIYRPKKMILEREPVEMQKNNISARLIDFVASIPSPPAAVA